MQQVGREPAAAASQLDDLAPAGDGKDRRDLRRERGREQGCELWRRHEIAGRTELPGPRHVVPETRRVQREVHVSVERQEAAGCVDRGADVRHDKITVRAR